MAVKRVLWMALAAAMVLVVAVAVRPDAASASFGIEHFGGAATNPDGMRNALAGGHPDVKADFGFALRPGSAGWPDDNVRDVDIDLPPGLIGNPSIGATCNYADLFPGAWVLPICSPDTQVGLVEVDFNLAGSLITFPTPLVKIDPPPGAPAAFAFSVLSVVVTLVPELRGSDYGLTIHTNGIAQSLAVLGTRVTMWGVPADPVHDEWRWNNENPLSPWFGTPSSLPKQAFIMAPDDCSAGLLTTTMRARGWADPVGWRQASFDHDLDGNPMQVEDCDALSFEPSFGAAPTVTRAGAPTGLAVDLGFPQFGLVEPNGRAPARLRDAVVTLPEGMTINPSSAEGLAVCDDAQLGLGDNHAARCSDAAKLGSVTARTPLLEEPLTGGVYLRPQASGDPESGQMFRIALVLANEERGIVVKLAGSVRADRTTGRLVATFANNPQLPVSSLRVVFDGGPRAALALPASCGTHTIDAELTSWTGKTVQRSSSFQTACAPGQGGFSPSFAAGTESSTAGGFSPFSLTVARGDGDQELSAIDRVELPAGLLAMVGSVPLCPESAAAAGTCAGASRVGRVQVAVGAGGSPLWAPQAGKAPTAVYLAGPYKGAPYSLSIVVPAQAGPFDLGRVVVRSALFVDPKDAHVTAQTDPLPRIVGGVPLRVREVRMVLDRERFMFNPTSCAQKQVRASVLSGQGARASLAARFQASDCQAMPISPVIRASGGGKGNTKRFTHPSLKVSIKQTSAQAHLDKVNVVLPKAFNVDLQAPSLKAACPREVYAQDKCSPVATVGSVKAVTPVFAEPLTGPAFLLQKKGQLPDIVMRLRNTHYSIDLIGVLDFLGDSRVITRVKNIPDAPITSFELTIKGGKGGSLLNRTDLCAKKAATQATFKGQNGKVVVKSPTTAISGCAAKASARSRKASTAAGAKARDAAARARGASVKARAVGGRS